MSKIRDSANGQPCLVRIPGICNHDPETTVAAHIRIPDACGIGIKPMDAITVRACSACHDEIDRRTRFVDIETLDALVFDALIRTLIAYEREGLIVVK